MVQATAAAATAGSPGARQPVDVQQPVHGAVVQAVYKHWTDVFRSSDPKPDEKDEKDEPDDPLLLNGCKVLLEGERRVSWRPKLLKYRLRSSSEGQEKLTFEELLERIEHSKHAGHRGYTVSKFRVLTQGSHQPKKRWSKQEDAALQARRLAGEPYDSLALSLGRTLKAVANRANQLLDPSYTRASGTAGVHTGARVNWRARVAEALRLLPDCRGTTQQICAKVETLPPVMGKLDRRTYPGSQKMERWQHRVSTALSENPEFAKVGKVGNAAIWKLVDQHIPAKKPRQAVKRDKGKFMGKGKSMGQGGH